MLRSIKLGRIAGIDVFVHWTFLILIAYLLGIDLAAGRGLGAALSGVGFMLLLFLIVILHEYGHALTARRYGIKTKDITLYPIGGVARLERMPSDPRQELVVALAGPAVNAALALILWAILRTPDPNAMDEGALQTTRGFLTRLLWINVWLGGFNLLPAFPMDGGRVLRALLATRMDYVRATRIAAGVGQAFATLFGLAGLFFNPFLVFIAFFVWVGAEAEAQDVSVRAAIEGLDVSRLMVTKFEVITSDTPLERVSRRMMDGFQTDFPVVEDGRLLGLLSRDQLVKGLSEGGGQAAAGVYMQKELQVFSPHEPLEKVLAAWDRASTPVVVDDSGKVVGLITSDNIAEHLMLAAASRAYRERMPEVKFEP